MLRYLLRLTFNVGLNILFLLLSLSNAQGGIIDGILDKEIHYPKVDCKKNESTGRYECGDIYKVKSEDRDQWNQGDRDRAEGKDRNNATRQGCILTMDVPRSDRIDHCADSAGSAKYGHAINARAQTSQNTLYMATNLSLSPKECGVAIIDQERWWYIGKLKYIKRKICADIIDPNTISEKEYQDKYSSTVDQWGFNVKDNPVAPRLKKICAFVATNADYKDGDGPDITEVKKHGDVIGCVIANLQQLPDLPANRLPSISVPTTVVPVCPPGASTLPENHDCYMAPNPENRNTLIKNTVIITNPIQMDVCLDREKTLPKNCLALKNYNATSDNKQPNVIKKCSNYNNEPCITDIDLDKIHEYIKIFMGNDHPIEDAFIPIYGDIVGAQPKCINTRYSPKNASAKICGINIGTWKYVTLDLLKQNPGEDLQYSTDITFQTFNNQTDSINLKTQNSDLCYKIKSGSGKAVCIPRPTDDVLMKLRLTSANNRTPAIAAQISSFGDESSIVTLKPRNIYNYTSQDPEVSNKLVVAGLEYNVSVEDDISLLQPNGVAQNFNEPMKPSVVTRCFFDTKTQDPQGQNTNMLVRDNHLFRCGSTTATSSLAKYIRTVPTQKGINEQLDLILGNDKTASNPDSRMSVFNTEGIYLTGVEYLDDVYVGGGQRVCATPNERIFKSRDDYLLIKCSVTQGCITTEANKIGFIDSSQIERIQQEIDTFFADPKHKKSSMNVDISFKNPKGDLVSDTIKVSLTDIPIREQYTYFSDKTMYSNTTNQLITFNRVTLKDAGLCSNVDLDPIVPLNKGCSTQNDPQMHMYFQATRVNQKSEGRCLPGYLPAINAKPVIKRCGLPIKPGKDRYSLLPDFEPTSPSMLQYACIYEKSKPKDYKGDAIVLKDVDYLYSGTPFKLTDLSLKVDSNNRVMITSSKTIGAKSEIIFLVDFSKVQLKNWSGEKVSFWAAQGISWYPISPEASKAGVSSTLDRLNKNKKQTLMKIVLNSDAPFNPEEFNYLIILEQESK